MFAEKFDNTGWISELPRQRPRRRFQIVCDPQRGIGGRIHNPESRRRSRGDFNFTDKSTTMSKTDYTGVIGTTKGGLG
jgi:hypothetical protein